ncbi:MAG: hypothetical protein IPK82_35240 [Polyangiaceae bacterium]|nr:hypothetical protein [Polyangiaceae bacterium]
MSKSENHWYVAGLGAELRRRSRPPKWTLLGVILAAMLLAGAVELYREWGGPPLVDGPIGLVPTLIGGLVLTGLVLVTVFGFVR